MESDAPPPTTDDGAVSDDEEMIAEGDASKKKKNKKKNKKKGGAASTEEGEIVNLEGDAGQDAPSGTDAADIGDAHTEEDADGANTGTAGVDSAAKKKRDAKKRAAARKKAEAEAATATADGGEAAAAEGTVPVYSTQTAWQTIIRGIQPWGAYPKPEKGGKAQKLGGEWGLAVPVLEQFPSGDVPRLCAWQ